MSRTDGQVQLGAGDLRGEDVPTITVLLPVFNGERYLRAQVESILGQSVRGLRVVALDDASGDGSLALLRELAARDSRLEVRASDRNLGLIENLARLMSQVDTDYFALSDQDDVWDENKLVRSISHLRETGAVLTYSDVRICDSDGNVVADSYFRTRHIRPVSGSDIAPFVFRNPAIGHTMVATRAVAEQAKDMPRNLAFHEAWIVAAAQSIGNVVYIEDQLGSYRTHRANVVGPRERRLLKRGSAVLFGRSRLVRRQRTRSAALSAVSQFHPEIRGLADAYAVSGWRKLRVLPRAAGQLVRLRGSLGLRQVVVESAMFALDALVCRSDGVPVRGS